MATIQELIAQAQKNAQARNQQANAELQQRDAAIQENARAARQKYYDNRNAKLRSEFGYDTLQTDSVRQENRLKNLYDKYQRGDYVSEGEFQDALTANGDIQNRLNKYKDYLSLNKQDTSSVDGSIKNYGEIEKELKSLQDYMKQFSSPSAYMQNWDNVTYTDKYKGYTLSDIDKAIQGTSGREQNWLNEHRYDYASAEELQSAIDGLPRSYRTDPQVAELKTKLKQTLAQKKRAEAGAEYVKAANGQQNTAELVNPIRWADNPNGGIVVTDWGKLAKEINRPTFSESYGDVFGYFDSVLQSMKEREEESGTPVMVADELPFADILDLYKELTPEEKTVLNNLRANYGGQAAVNYLDTIKAQLGQRAEQRETEQRKQINDQLPAWARVLVNDIGGSLASVPLNLVSGVLAAGNDAVDKLLGDSFNPYNKGHRTQTSSQTMRNIVAQNIEDKAKWEIGGHNVASEVYQALMSGADSALGAATMGSLYLGAMGLGAATAQAKKAYEEGRSDESIFASALMAGLAEVLTEKAGFERITNWIKNPQTFRQIAKGVLKSIIPEAAEEIAADLINNVTDAFLNAGDTQLDRDVEKIMSEQGVDRETAQSIAYKDRVADYIWSGVGGAVASMVSAGRGAVNSAQAAKIGKALVSANLTTDVLEKAKGLKETDMRVGEIPFESAKAHTERQSEAYKQMQETLDRVEKALDEGKNPSNGDVGVLAQLAGYAYDSAAVESQRDFGQSERKSYDARYAKAATEEISSLAEASNNHIKNAVRRKSFRDKFSRVFGDVIDSDNLSIVEKANIVRTAAKQIAEFNEKDVAGEVRNRLGEKPTEKLKRETAESIRKSVINPIAAKQRELVEAGKRNSPEWAALQTKRRLYGELVRDIENYGTSRATVFLGNLGSEVKSQTENEAVKGIEGYDKLSAKTKQKIEDLGQTTNAGLMAEGIQSVISSTRSKKDKAVLGQIQEELQAKSENRKDAAREEIDRGYGESVRDFVRNAEQTFAKYGIKLSVRHKNGNDSFVITTADGSVIENESRASVNPTARIIEMFDDISRSRVEVINYLTGQRLLGHEAEFVAGHEGAHLAIEADVNFIGRVIDALGGSKLDIYGFGDANVRFNEQTGRYQFDRSKLNERGRRFLDQMEKNLKATGQRVDEHSVLEEAVCDMCGSVVASDSFTKTLAEGSALGNLFRKAVNGIARLGNKILRKGNAADNVEKTKEQARKWLEKYDALVKQAANRIENLNKYKEETQETATNKIALLNDIKSAGIKTDLSVLPESMLEKLAGADSIVAEAQKLLGKTTGDNAERIDAALNDLIKENPAEGSVSSKLDAQLNTLVENAPAQKKRNRKVAEAKTLQEAQESAVQAFKEETPLDAPPMDESVEPINTEEIKEVVGADPETIVDVPKNSMSTMFEGAGFEFTEPRWDEEGNLVNDPLTITYNGKKISRDEMTGEFIRSTDSPVMTLLNASIGKSLLTKEQMEKITDDFASILRTAMEFGDTGGGVSAIDSIWRWAVKDNAFKPVKSNSDKQYKRSIDFLTICKKTEELLGTVSQYQVENKHGMTPAEVMKAYYETGKAGFQTPCPLCYVFSRWIDNGKTQQTQYTAQQYYGDASKSGLKYRALNAEEFAQLSDEEKDDYIKVWNKEQKRQKAWAEKNKTATDAARKDVQGIFTEFDRLFAEKEKGADVDDMLSALNERYIAAANLLAYSDFGGWITYNVLQFKTEDGETVYPKKYSDTLNVTKKSGNRMVNHGNAVPVYKEVPADILFDYFRIAECYENRYDGFLRFKSSKGSEAGKGVETESNNAFGSVIAGLATNPQSVKEAKNMLLPIFEKGISDKEKAKRTKAFDSQFDTAIKNARRQSLIGGQRFFSWSDNRVEYGPDMFSAFVQLQTLGCSVQSYTKQLEGLNLISQMGGYVNGSLIAKGLGYKNGKLVYSDRQGINHAETFKLNKLNDKAGNILVGMNDEHILIGLADDEVFFIIPYHQSGLKKEFLLLMMDMLNEPYVDSNGNKISVDEAATDYTDVQEEKIPGVLSGAAKDKDGNEISYGIDSYLSDFWTKISDALDKESKNSDYDFGFLNENRISHGDGNLSEEQIEYRRLRARTILNQFEDGDLEKVQADPFLSQIHRKINETYDTPVSMTSDEVNAIYPYEYWDENTTYDTANVNGMRYLEYCRRLGVQPKFSGLLNSADPNHRNFALRDGNFVDGYWKLLIDRRMYRNVYDADGNWVSYNGEYQGTDSVTADNFNLDLILPSKINERFEVTRSADKSTFKDIARKTRESLENQGYDVDRFYIETGSQKEALENYADLKNSMSLEDWENNPEADHRVAEGIYISNEGKNKFSDWILDGKKTIETRNMDKNGTGTLDPFVGRRVGIITDGKLVGYVTISRRVEFDKNNWGKYRDKHLVPTGSDYDIANSPTGKKVGYVLSNPIKLKNPIDIKYEGNRTHNTIRPKDAKGPTFVSFFTGGGTVDNVVAPYVDQIAVAELDPKMTSAFALNYSGNVENLGYLTHDEEGNVIGMDVRKFLKNTKLRKGDVFAFHSSPCCQNFSSAKADRGEKDVNRETAQATADFIDMVEPYVVTIENVEGYKSSDSVQIILDALKRNGYKTNGIEILEATDFGAAASRKRLFIRAVKEGGVMPDLAEFHRPAKGWYEVLKDRVENPEYFTERAALPDHVMKGIKEDGIDLTKKNQQILMAGRTNDREKYFAGKESRPSRLIMSYGNEPAKTFTASERQYLAVINGKVYDVQPRAIATLMGLSDSFTLPENKVDAFHLIGNGVSGELTSAVVTPLIRDNWEQLESKGELTDNVKNSSSSADAYQPLTEEQTEWGRLNDENKDVGSPLYNMSGNLQGRWKNSVGKEVGGIYVHKDYAREVAAKLFGNLDTLRKAEQIAKDRGIEYNCVMLDKSKPNVVRLDESPNFDTADEPYPGKTYTIDVTDGSVKEGFSDRIWHHKWMWVKNDYKGFNVEDSWNRSKEYLNRIRKLDAPKGSLEYEMSHNGTANGSARGYDKWNEQLEYFGIEPKHSMSVEDEQYLKDMYGLDEFKLATPTAGWKQTLLKNDAEKIMPDLWKKTEQKVENNEKAGRDPTQRPITVSSYRNVFAKLKEEGFSGNILDASSGLGLGTKAGREEPFNFDVDDVELYPEESYNPRYRSYADIKKKYDVIISNAVLNVLPQDYRDALVTKMGQLLNDGGRMFINVRSTDVNNVDKDRNINTGENEWLIPKDGSYQKGFLKSELVAYLKDALGGGFTVIPYNGFKGGTWALVTKNDKIKASPAITATNESGRQSAGNALNANNYTANSSKSQEANNKKVGQSRTLDTSATVNNYTTNSSESQGVSGKNSSSVITPNMTDEERAAIISKKGIENIPAAQKEISQEILESVKNIKTWDDIDSLFGKDRKLVLRKLAEEFGIFKRYLNKDIDIELVFSKSNLKESINKQKSNYSNFAKMFSVFENVIENAVGIETHNRNSEGYKTDPTLENVYVLISAFESDGLIIPVKLEIKEFNDKDNILYIAVTAENKKAEVYKPESSDDVAPSPRSVSYSIAQIMRFVNPSETDFTKYFPKSMLTAEQAEVLNAEKNSSSVDSNGNELTPEQAEFFKDSKVRDENGNLLLVRHGSPNKGIKIFSHKRGGEQTGADRDKAMFWFTDSAAFAEKFSHRFEPHPRSNFLVTLGEKGEVYDGYVNITKPFDFRNLSEDEIAMLWESAKKHWAWSEKDYTRWRKDFDYVQSVNNHQLNKLYVDYDMLREAGYDGLIARTYSDSAKNYDMYRGMEDALEFGVFESSQFKRADNLSPTKKQDIRYSSSVDSDGEELTEEQIEYFKDSKIRDERGRLLPVYHGTPHATFTIFDPKKGKWSHGLFFTDNVDVADYYAEYSGKLVRANMLRLADRPGIYRVYLNITNPLIVEGRGRDWTSLTEEEPDMRFEYITLEGRNGDRYNVSFGIDPGSDIDLENGWFTEDELVKLLGRETLDQLLERSEIYGVALDKNKNRLTATTDDWVNRAEKLGHDGVVFRDVYDGNGPADIFAALSPDQVKLTTNAYPTHNRDISFSMSVDFRDWTEDDFNQVNEDLEQERKLLSIASKELALSGPTAKIAEKIRQGIVTIIDSTGTEMTYDEIRQAISDIYRYVYYKTDKVDGKYVKVEYRQKRATNDVYSLASRIIDSAMGPAFSKEETELFRSVSKRIHSINAFKGGKLSPKAAAGLGLGDIADILQKSPVETRNQISDLYGKLTMEFPAMFGDGDGKFPYSENVAVQYDQLFKIDKQMKRLANEKAPLIEGSVEREQVKATTARLIAEIIYQANDPSQYSKTVSRLEKRMEREYEKYVNAVEKLRETADRLTENYSKDILRAKAAKRIAAVTRTLGAPTRAKHLNEDIKPIAKKLLQEIVPYLPTRTQGEQKIYRTLNGLLNNSKTGPAAGAYSDAFAQPIEDLNRDVDEFIGRLKGLGAKGRFNELGINELSTLSKLLYRIASLSSRANKSLYFQRNYRELSAQTAAELKSVKKERTGKLSERTLEFLSGAALDPAGGFNLLGSETLDACFENIVRSQNNFATVLYGWIGRMKDIVGDKVKTEWHTEAETYHFRNGDLKLTRAQLMSLYLLWQQNDSKLCLERSGVKPAENSDITEKAKETTQKLSTFAKEEKKEPKRVFKKHIPSQAPVKITAEDIIKVREILGEEGTEMCRQISALLNGEVAAAGNEVSLAMEGYRKFLIDNYFPMIVDRNGSYEESVKNLGMYLAQPGFTKERNGQSKVLLLDDMFYVVEKHLLGMAQYATFTESLADLIRIYGNRYDSKSVAGTVSDLYGAKSIRNFMPNFISDVQGQQMNAYEETMLTEKFLRNYKKAAVAANLSTVAKQPTAIIRAYPEFSKKGIAAMKWGKALLKEKTEADIEEMCRYSGLARMKSWGFSENASPKSLRQLYDVNEEKRFRNRFESAISWGAEKADMVTWAAIWRGCKAEYTDSDGNVDFVKATRKFNDVIIKTQVVQTATTTTRIAYQPGLAKLFFAFKNEPLKTFNYVRSSLLNLARDPKNPQALKKFVYVATAAALNSAVTALITTAFSMGRDEDDDTDELLAKFVEKWSANVLDDLLETSLVAFADLASVINTDNVKAVFTGKTGDIKVNNMAVDSIINAMKAVGVLFGDGFKPQNERTKSIYNICYGLSRGVSDLSGIPIRTFMRSVKTVSYAVANLSGDPYLKYLVVSTYYNANGYDSTTAKTEFKAILTDALNHKNWEGYSKVRKKLQYHGYSSTDIESAIKSADVFREAYDSGNLEQLVREANAVDKTITMDTVMKSIKSAGTGEITDLFDEMKAHGKSRAYKELVSDLEGRKNPNTGKNYTEKEIEDLIEDKTVKAVKSDVKKRLAGVTPTDPVWDKVCSALAKEYSRLGVTKADVDRIARESF